ncbi:hypothetical protein BHE74_00006699 [Ensete ventricosum]|nr:hypothetical protein BHE74_00006699 [Ensete ventricosum]
MNASSRTTLLREQLDGLQTSFRRFTISGGGCCSKNLVNAMMRLLITAVGGRSKGSRGGGRESIYGSRGSKGEGDGNPPTAAERKLPPTEAEEAGGRGAGTRRWKQGGGEGNPLTAAERKLSPTEEAWKGRQESADGF